jgi:TrmH family RNA methyltransferase
MVSSISSMPVLSSRHNPQFQYWQSLAQSNGAYRRHRQLWLEGAHLCQAWLHAGDQKRLPIRVICTPETQADWQTLFHLNPGLFTCVTSDLMRQLSALPSPAAVGFIVPLPGAEALDQQEATVVLDAVQDPGNVGSILRTAAAMGFTQVIALEGTAALWSPKVLRAAMGAHFGLHLIEGQGDQILKDWPQPLLAAMPHQGMCLHDWLKQEAPCWPCTWVFGHEGTGIQANIHALCTQHICIAQPGGQESLGVAAAAAICLHATAMKAMKSI